jgi:hypothetical protein
MKHLISFNESALVDDISEVRDIFQEYADEYD